MEWTPPMRVFFGTVALKSPFEKGDLGGFSSAYEIPPDPPLPKGGTRKVGFYSPLLPIGFHEFHLEVHFISVSRLLDKQSLNLVTNNFQLSLIAQVRC